MDITLQKLPPQSIEAEESFLSAAMLGSAIDASELISPDDFYRTAHKTIFESICSLIRKKSNVDLVTVVNELRASNSLEEVGGASYIARLIDVVPSAASLAEYAKIIKITSQKRQLIKICSETIQGCYGGISLRDLIGGLDKGTSKIQTHSGSFFKMGDLLPGMIDKWEQMKLNPGPQGIPCGLSDLDRRLGGFQGKNLYVIGARPSMGKSALGMRIIRGAARNGFPGLFISVEMSKEQVCTREVSCLSGVDGERFLTGDLNYSNWEHIVDAAGQIDPMPIWIDDHPTANIRDVQSKIRQFYKRFGRCIVVIDYLGYIEGLKSERKDLEIGTVTRGLKTSSKEHDIPIVLLSQLGRELEKRTDKRPIMSDLRGSGEIEQDADVIMFIYRDEVYNDDKNNPNKGIAEIIIRKYRNGKIGTIFLSWIQHRATFENLAQEGRR